MKYKNLTKEQIIISLDRLTRFKNTREKYLRVFSDILVSNLIEPKLKKQEIEEMDFSLISEYVSVIFNSSVKSLAVRPSSLESRKNIIELLRFYENSIFINDEDTQKLLDNDIDYLSAIEFIPDNCPVNLRWLRELINLKYKLSYNDVSVTFTKAAKQVRNDKKLKYPIEEVLLVEGITEEVLLPAFSKYLGYDFYANGVQVIAAGGKNQVVKMYYKLARELKIPIFVLLDQDAEENIAQIKPRLRDIDRIHLVSCGEFEDLLPKSLIVKTVNSHFKNFLSITEFDLESNLPAAKLLEELFKTKGLHEFKKAEFAKLVREKIQEDSDISDEILVIVKEISSTNKMLDSKICS